MPGFFNFFDRIPIIQQVRNARGRLGDSALGRGSIQKKSFEISEIFRNSQCIVWPTNSILQNSKRTVTNAGRENKGVYETIMDRLNKDR